MLLRPVAVCLLAATALAAQRPARRNLPPAAASKPAAPDRWPLASIRIVGNKVFPTDAIVRATGLRPGAAVNQSDFQQALDRLTDTGAFETISFRYTPEGQKLSVTFEVQEVPDIYPVGFERLDVPDAELIGVLKERVPLFGPRIPATGAMVSRIVQVLQAYLAEKKKPAEIAGKLLPGSGGRLVMTFQPTAPLPVITFVKFENSTLIRNEDLQKALYQAAVGVPYTEPRLRELLDNNIRPLFEEKGRLQVRFGPIRTEESKDAAGVVVTVPVEEGEEFHFGSVQFAGDAELARPSLARLAKPLVKGEPANFALVNQTVSGVERLYQRHGFLHAKADVGRTLDEKNKAVDLVIRIRQGAQYTLRSLQIKGLDFIGEEAVRKRWAIQKGQPFDGAYPETFLQRIEQEGMFDQLGKSIPHVNVDEEAKAVDVELEFRGAPSPQKRPAGDPF